MKVIPEKEGLFIEPETDFEIDYLKTFQNESFKVFVKCGLTPAEVLGLKIKVKT